jgi:AcrR family transcriptional regulator
LSTVSSTRPANNREALLEGALRCLQDHGYARTTARDIVAASGTNLGAIGYHYGSTERLLNRALLEGFERWFAELAQAATEASDDAQPLVAVALALPATFDRHRPLVRALVEAFAQADHSEEIRGGLVDAYEKGRDLTIGLLIPGDTDDAHARVFASLLIAIFDGLLIQWLVDPEHAPTGEELLSAFVAVAPNLQIAEGSGAP